MRFLPPTFFSSSCLFYICEESVGKSVGNTKQFVVFSLKPKLEAGFGKAIFQLFKI